MQSQKTYTLHKPKNINFKRSQFVSSEIDGFWATDLADLSKYKKYNDNFNYLLIVIDILTKYSWVVPLKNLKNSTMINAFKIIFKSKGNLIF